VGAQHELDRVHPHGYPMMLLYPRASIGEMIDDLPSTCDTEIVGM